MGGSPSPSRVRRRRRSHAPNPTYITAPMQHGRRTHESAWSQPVDIAAKLARARQAGFFANTSAKLSNVARPSIASPAARQKPASSSNR